MANCNTTPTTSFKTLEDIALRKEELLIEINASKNQLLDTAQGVFSPPPAIANSTNSIVRHLGTGMVIYNGVRNGMKIVKVIKGFLKRTK